MRGLFCVVIRKSKLNFGIFWPSVNGKLKFSRLSFKTMLRTCSAKVRTVFDN
jgi:hypothetical protein